MAFSKGRQLALAQPSTKTSLDLGLVLKDAPAGGRLQEAGSFGSGRITHRVALEKPQEVDSEVRGWIAEAAARP